MNPLDHTNNIDITLTKTFTIRERVKIQFRAESFNLCNKPLFTTPTLTATSSSFGTIGSQTNNPRYIQFGLGSRFDVGRWGIRYQPAPQPSELQLQRKLNYGRRFSGIDNRSSARRRDGGTAGVPEQG